QAQPARSRAQDASRHPGADVHAPRGAVHEQVARRRRHRRRVDSLLVRAALIVLATTASASAQDPVPDPYPKPLAPQPQPVEPQPQAPVLQLSAVDAAILERGEIDSSVHYGGVLANVVIGFGLGQAIQGRWLE